MANVIELRLTFFFLRRVYVGGAEIELRVDPTAGE